MFLVLKVFSKKTFLITLSYSLPFGTWILIGWFINLSVQCPDVLITNHNLNTWGNFVCHNFECTSIYAPLSYSYRSLEIIWLIICNKTLKHFSVFCAESLKSLFMLTICIKLMSSLVRDKVLRLVKLVLSILYLV